MNKIVCLECGTKFEYSDKDIQTKVLRDGKEHHYVLCPSCKSMIFID